MAGETKRLHLAESPPFEARRSLKTQQRAITESRLSSRESKIASRFDPSFVPACRLG
jgi:hypothetical protein